MTLQDALAIAVRLLQEGRAGDAGVVARQILDAVPEQPDALGLLGVVAGQERRFEEACALFARALAGRPNSPDLHINMGNARRAMGDPASAVAGFRAALALESCNSAAIAGLVAALPEAGLQTLEAGRGGDAEAYFRAALAWRPDDELAWFHLGGVLQDRGASQPALEAYRAAITCRPVIVEAWINLALLFGNLADADRECKAWRLAAAVDPARARVLEELARPEDGEGKAAWRRRMLALLGSRANANDWLNYALLLPPLPKNAALRRALSFDPACVGALNNLGNDFKESRRLEAALSLYGRALRADPKNPSVLANRATLWRMLGQPQAALSDAAAATSEAAPPADAVFIHASSLLTLGRLREGWEMYDRYWNLIPGGDARRPDLPRLFRDGPVSAGRVLVWGDQGVGDEIMFSCLLEELVQAGFGVMIECDHRLAALFRRSFPRLDVLGRASSSAPPPENADFVAQIPARDLPRWFRPDLESFTRTRSPYLFADPDRVASIRRRLAGPGDRLIGLSWRSVAQATGRDRSVPLISLATILARNGVKLVSLQYGDTIDERRAAERSGAPVYADSQIDTLNDLDGLAALVAAMDLVVSIDNTTVHLAGALGVPVWTLLPVNADWRWLCDQADSPWYPTMKLLRQETPGDWSPVFDCIGRELDGWLDSIT